MNDKLSDTDSFPGSLNMIGTEIFVLRSKVL